MYKIIGVDKKEYGPVGADQIRQWIAEGRVNAQTKVQPAGSAEWKSVAEVPELAAALPKEPAPTALTMPAQYPPAPGTSQMAMWAMITGIGSLLCCCGWYLVAPAAIVLGAVALYQLKSRPELTGGGFAITGIVLGIVAILIYGAVTVFYICNPDYFQNLQSHFQP